MDTAASNLINESNIQRLIQLTKTNVCAHCQTAFRAIQWYNKAIKRTVTIYTDVGVLDKACTIQSTSSIHNKYYHPSFYPQIRSRAQIFVNLQTYWGKISTILNFEAMLWPMTTHVWEQIFAGIYFCECMAVGLQKFCLVKLSPNSIHTVYNVCAHN